MKKLLFVLLASALLYGCGESPERYGQGGDGTGSIIVSYRQDNGVDDIVVTTRTSVDPEDYTLCLNGPSGEIKTRIPEDGKIANLKPGDYTVKLTSHPDGWDGPAFGTPVYEALLPCVTITANTRTEVALNCVQANAGIFFVYDQSIIDAGILNLTPVITQDGSQLIYVGANKKAVGYFNPGEIVVTMKDDETPVPIAGQDSKTLTVNSQQLWKITLKVSGTRSGDGPILICEPELIN